eukprot:CAMPEP_0171430218 /NCGR_PEP_ID=MMETSP0881-20121228/6422_1 /TAXON_ID=67004 /ORGANISM="Thalassiosira weissflogii, Strain CCMP1336" /LENGTH=764 /DNA_ID=CAMNT_0011950289 /DNA_START=4 /DNA_END=2298 /DNA_ORIENTATION=+
MRDKSIFLAASALTAAATATYLPSLASAFLLPSATTSFSRNSKIINHPSSAIATAASRRKHLLPLSAATTSSTTTAASSSRTTSEELIPRSILFGNPENTSPILSPDGKYLAYLAPSPDGVLNIFIRDLQSDKSNGSNDKKNDRMITNEPKRAIRSVSWAYDSQTVLYMNDFDGDENFHLFAVDATTIPDGENGEFPTPRDLTPGENIKAQTILLNYRYPDEILIGTNGRNPKVFDMYRCFYKTGELVLDTINPGDVIGWKVEDESFEVRGAVARNEVDSSSTVRIRKSADLINNDSGSNETEWRDVFHFPYGEEGGLLSFCPDNGKTGYITSSLGRETTALLKVDLETGETIEEIFSNDKCNVGGVTLDKDTKEVRAITYNYARTERVFFDKELEKDYEFLKANAPIPDAEVGVVSRTLDETKWVISYYQSDGPTSYYVYDKSPGRNDNEKETSTPSLTPLFVSNPKLLPYKFSPMEDVRITARDGLELVGYLTRAVEKGSGTSPLILLVHGGPWARDSWGFRAQCQWFANRGYATLQVNYRGSTGYGKTFLHKGDKQWGVGDMQHDLTDAVQWAIDEGIADKDNICIYGGSYGGYACLAGLTFTPDLYKCGVDIVGPSNIKTLLDSVPPYWAPLRNGMLKKIGDVDNDPEFNEKISPFFHVDKIKAPLLIGHGANDPRVKQAEADQIAFSMHEKGIPVEYVLYPDEGHGFARPENRIDFNGRVEQFLAKHLGGRAEEMVEVEGSTARFPLLEGSSNGDTSSE